MGEVATVSSSVSLTSAREDGLHSGRPGDPQARIRFCPSCGRSIDWDAASCPYCSWTQTTLSDAGVYCEPPSTLKTVALYVCSLLIPIFGIALGIIYLDRDDECHKSLGMKCLIIGAISLIMMPMVLAAVLYVAVLGF